MADSQPQASTNKGPSTQDAQTQNRPALPAISLPKGGGAIKGIGEKFAANPVTGTGSLSVPLAVSPGRSNFGPQLSLAYDSGAGNGPFGFGWSLGIPRVTRKTDKGIPRYRDEEESDVFILSEAEDLVPALSANGEREIFERSVADKSYVVQRYRPRIEGLFARIERWRDRQTAEVHWRVTTKDNVTSIYGDSPNNNQIADPENQQHVFSWLLSRTYDDKGNLVVYEYKAEDASNVVNDLHEQNRQLSANRYIKRIFYCHQTPYFPADNSVVPNDWHFQVVFDYGEHDLTLPRVEEDVKWSVRPDSFSTYRSGFEIRTHRRCRRVLMFHSFPELGDSPYLVRSTDLSFADAEDTSQSLIATFVSAVTHSSYVKQNGGYLRKSFPPIEFGYTKAEIDQTVHLAESSLLENLPEGIDGSRYQSVDIDGEGASGVLTQLYGAWYYKRNLAPLSSAERSGPQFGVTEVLKLQPAHSTSAQQLLDLAGDGLLDVVQFEGATSGFFERTEDSKWDSFTAFISSPNIRWGDGNLKFIDLTGDGHADVLISEDEVFTWYPSLGEEGFGAAETVRKAANEEDGPRIVFADGTQSVYLADMSGDGLNDLVRVRNAEVCYWPNLGYGRFGSKVTMSNAPLLDHPDLFDQKRVRLADIDGSGVTDIIYLGQDLIRVYFNRSGNSWSPAVALDQMPPVDNLASIMAMDLLGNGTACLVWSHPGPAHANQAMRYVDLMGGTKPHLLTTIKNNLGAETRMKYVPSTVFYLNDLYDGKPWITRLPFPVHVLEQVEVFDWVSKTKLVTRYKYHHGYFDGVEREFRGFGMVEQWDTEQFVVLSNGGTFPEATNVDDASHIPPVCVKTWFHTGAYFQEGRISRHFEDEYYREGDESEGNSELTNEQVEAMLLPDTEVPTALKLADGSSVSWELTAEEVREACRALKGSILRQEIYALDGSDEEDRPYSASERSYTIELLQPQGENKHAVFFTHSRETVDFHYERKLFDVSGNRVADPRVTHSITFAVDRFGNVLTAANIGYGRRHDAAEALFTAADHARQKQTQITFIVSTYTNPVEEADAYRAPLPSDVRTFELIELPSLTPAAHNPQITNLFPFAELEAKIQAAGDGDHEINYENVNATGIQAGHPYRRPIEHIRTLYRRDDLSGPLALGELQSLALPFEIYKLAFTTGLVQQVYGSRVSDEMLTDEGGFVHSENDSNWWIPSGQAFYSPQPDDTSVQELAFARQHFFLAHRSRDPFGATSTIHFDDYDLLTLETEDPLHNKVTIARNNYRVLQPELITDANRNRSEVAFDAMGLVVGTALRGKADESQGDSLADFEPDLDDATIGEHLENPLANPHAILRNATTRLVYDLFAYQRTQNDPQPLSAVVYTMARETHTADLAAGVETKVQHSFSYSDGFSREIQKKVQAEPGPVPRRDAAGKIILGADGQPEVTPNEVSPRWVGSGWTIFNNKGKPVRQYEPFFSDTHHFDFDARIGVSPTLFYDPLERVVATLHPNHTWRKVVFDPWEQATFDVNDTVLNADGTTDPKSDQDAGGFFSRLAVADYLPTWYEQRRNLAASDPERIAADKAAVHRQTPTVAHFDALGRTFVTISQNRFERNGVAIEERFPVRIDLDIEGNQRTVRDAAVQNGDALGRIVMSFDYDMLGNVIHQSSMEAGERWMLNDVMVKSVRSWDSRGFTRHITYDELRRPTGLFVTENGSERLAQRTVYGESEGDTNNHRTRVFQVFDGAGVVTNEGYDFKGNLLGIKRDLLPDYGVEVNWIQNLNANDGTFLSKTEYDALNRPIAVTTPDKSLYRPTYNEASLLNTVDVHLRGADTATPFVTNIDYNAKGQRTLIRYANGVETKYTHDKNTFRLTNVTTTRTGQDDFASQIFLSADRVQDLSYTYDAVGNITRVEDAALSIVFHAGEQVEPVCDYTYDAVYRLIESSGREHIAQTAHDFNPPVDNRRDIPFIGSRVEPNDLQALRRYIERYEYDAVGNFQFMRHVANGGSWTRDYDYEEESLIEPAKQSNRLTRTTIGNFTETYTYADAQGHDVHGCMTTINSLKMVWNFEDQLRQVDLGGGGTAFYVYDASNQRVRKVIETQNGTRKEERIYIGGFEVFRKYNGNGVVTLERETLHVMDEKQRIALVETQTIASGNPLDTPTSLQRLQLSNHLGSACLEVDANGALISYEEYHSYGTTALQAMAGAAEVSLKRYRYTGKERDEETGLYYHGARYCASWLGRWTATDPAGLVDGTNLYTYARDNPVRLNDPTGRKSAELGSDTKDKVTYTSDKELEEAQAIYKEIRKTGLTFNSQASADMYNKLAQDAFDKASPTLKRMNQPHTTIVRPWTLAELRTLKLALAYYEGLDLKSGGKLSSRSVARVSEAPFLTTGIFGDDSLQGQVRRSQITFFDSMGDAKKQNKQVLKVMVHELAHVFFGQLAAEFEKLQFWKYFPAQVSTNPWRNQVTESDKPRSSPEEVAELEKARNAIKADVLGRVNKKKGAAAATPVPPLEKPPDDYAHKNPGEDVAVSVAEYFLNREEFEKNYKDRFKLISDEWWKMRKEVKKMSPSPTTP